MHSPIWSAFDGHHLSVGIPERFDSNDPARKQIFVPWGNLSQTRLQTYQEISNRFDLEFAEEIIYYTYNSNHINRCSSEDCWSVFQSSTFDIIEHQITFPFNTKNVVQQALEQRHPGYVQISKLGVLAVLQRSGGSNLINFGSQQQQKLLIA